MATMKPSVGRIIHVAGQDKRCLAAIITEVRDFERGIVGIQVFSGGGINRTDAATERDEDKRLEGTWHEPERVE